MLFQDAFIQGTEINCQIWVLSFEKKNAILKCRRLPNPSLRIALNSRYLCQSGFLFPYIRLFTVELVGNGKFCHEINL